MKISKLLTLVVIVLLVLTSVVIASGGHMIEVFYRNIGIQVHGVEVPIAPENEPFILNGRTYVPLRLISEALGYHVGWEGETSTVLIGDSPEPPTTFRPVHTEYVRVLRFDEEADITVDNRKRAIGFEIQVGRSNPAILDFGLNAQYRRLTGILSANEISRGRGIIQVKFYGDGILIPGGAFAVGDTSIDVNLPVEGVKMLRMVVGGGDTPRFHWMYFGDTLLRN